MECCVLHRATKVKLLTKFSYTDEVGNYVTRGNEIYKGRAVVA